MIEFLFIARICVIRGFPLFGVNSGRTEKISRPIAFLQAIC